MRLRILLLPLSALIIAAVCEYRLAQIDERTSLTNATLDPPMRAPSIEALDSNGVFFRVDRYLGRQAFFVVFFDRQLGASGDPNLQLLAAHERELQSHGITVVAVSSALPQENRKAAVLKHTTFVTDLEPIWAAHHRWGCFNQETEKPETAVFFVDRAGNVPSRLGLPTRLGNPQKAILQILNVKPTPSWPTEGQHHGK